MFYGTTGLHSYYEGTGIVVNNTPSPTEFFNLDYSPLEIVLNGPNIIYIGINEEYTDLGASGVDMFNDSLMVHTINPVNTTQIGTYTVTYNANDNGVSADEVTRTVHVINKPIITINGRDTV